jgi:hypothetical protein
MISVTFHKLNRKISKKVLNNIIGPLKRKKYWLQYNNLAPENKVIWLDPWKEIDGFYRSKKEMIFEGQIKGGDWLKKSYIIRKSNICSKKELEKRIHTIPKTGEKYKGLKERFVEKKSWRNTALFKGWYFHDLDRVLKIRRCRNLAELEQHYETRYDKLFEDIRNRGIRPSTEPGIAPMYVCIGPDGQILHYSGSHRLFIAMLLDIEKVPYKILRRHQKWQEKREIILGGKSSGINEELSDFLNHPDLIEELTLLKQSHPTDSYG